MPCKQALLSWGVVVERRFGDVVKFSAFSRVSWPAGALGKLSSSVTDVLRGWGHSIAASHLTDLEFRMSPVLTGIGYFQIFALVL